MKIIKCLLTINLYKLTGKQIGDLKSQQINENHAYNFLPEYCFRKDTWKIDYSKYYFQFTDEGEEEYYLFDIASCEEPLGEEIRETGGYEGLDFDFSFIKNLPTMSYEKILRTLPISTNLVFNVVYERHADGEYEMNIELDGYLNELKEIQKL